MKRLTVIFIALVLLLCACGKKEASVSTGVDEATRDTLSAAVAAFNGQTKRQTAVTLSIEEGDVQRTFSQGTYAYDRARPIAMSGRATQVTADGGVTLDVFYKAGAYYYGGESAKFYMAMDRELFLKQYVCAQLPECDFDSATDLRVAETATGTKYQLAVDDPVVAEQFFAEELYAACGLKLPRKELTGFSAVSFTFVVDGDGALQSFGLDCTATLYDTGAYYPAYVATDEELKHLYSISYRVTVKALGDGVEITAPKTEDYTFLG